MRTLICLVLLFFISLNTIYPLPIIIASTTSDTIISNDDLEVIMLTWLTILLSDVPLDQVKKYELFHTLYVYRNQSLKLINQPYISSDIVFNITTYAYRAKELLENSTVVHIVNETGDYTLYYYNGSLIFSYVEYNSNTTLDKNIVYNSTIQAEEMFNKTLDANTVMYWRTVYSYLDDVPTEYVIIYLVTNISDTHKVYIATTAERVNNSYTYVYTIANYWFKNKTTFFGDWIILPEGADSLSDYYELLAYGVKWLSSNVYNGTSPGYLKQGSEYGYSPQAYPQIARALEKLARNIPQELNLTVEKGYALVLDEPLTRIVLCSGLGALINELINEVSKPSDTLTRILNSVASGTISGIICSKLNIALDISIEITVYPSGYSTQAVNEAITTAITYAMRGGGVLAVAMLTNMWYNKIKMM